MKIAVHYRNDLREDNFAHKWVEFLEKKNVEVLKLDFTESNIIEKIKGCDGAMMHYSHFPPDKIVAGQVLSAIETILKIPVFPNLETRWHFDEKTAQGYLLDGIEGVSMIEAKTFWDVNEALEYIKNAKYPFITKLSVGAGSANVIKINSYEEAFKRIQELWDFGIYPYTENEYTNTAKKSSVLKAIFGKPVKEKPPTYYQLQKNYFYVQEFMPDNEYDIRVSVIGNRAFGFVRHNRDNDFRASGSGKIDYNLDLIPLEAVKMAFKVSELCKFQSMAYDFLLDEQKKPVINEISYAYLNTAVYNCTGHWDNELNFHEGKMWPEEAHVEDFFNYINK